MSLLRLEITADEKRYTEIKNIYNDTISTLRILHLIITYDFKDTMYVRFRLLVIMEESELTDWIWDISWLYCDETQVIYN